MKEIKRVSAGVMFESDVLRLIDQLAAEQQRSRSFIINQIVRRYARIMQQKQTTQPKTEQEEPVVAINF